MDVMGGVKIATGEVSKNLISGARMINTYKEIAQVATTSAYGDRKIGVLIAEAMRVVGKRLDHIFVSLQKRGKPRIKLEFLSGITLHEGYTCCFIVTNKKKKICLLQCPSVFIYGGKLSDFDLVAKLLRDTESLRGFEFRK